MARGSSVQVHQRLLSRAESMWWLAGSAVYLAATGLVVALGVKGTAGWSDQEHFHLPTVRGLIEDLPAIDVVNVETATTPLYHLALALPGALLNLPDGAIQILGALFTVALLALLIGVTRGVPLLLRIPLVATVALSPYIWQSTLWMSTDSAAVLFGLLSLVLVLRAPESTRAAAFAGAAVAVAVATRQTYAWLLLPAALSCLLAPGPKRLPRFALAVVPGVVVLVAFVALWGGLTPPGFREYNASHASPVGLAYGAALWSFFAVALLATVRPPMPRRPALLAAGGIGAAVALLAVVFPSSHSDQGKERTGGWLWLLVRHTGEVADRSPLLCLLAFVGGFGVTLLVAEIWRRHGARTALIVASAAGGSLVAAASSAQVFQRYYEPPILICLVVMAVLLLGRQRSARQVQALSSLTALQAVALAAITGPSVLAAVT